MLTNVDCTIYNGYQEGAKTLYQKTVLRGVFWAASKSANIRQVGVNDADSVMIYIPFAVDAGGRGYLSPRQWAASEEKDKYWTLQPAAGIAARIMKGQGPEITETYKMRDLERDYDDVYNITTVDMADYGSPGMQHWEVSAK